MRIALLVALYLGVAALAVSCDDDTKMTIEDYLRHVDATEEELLTRLHNVDDPYEEGLTDGEALERARSVFAETLAYFQDFKRELQVVPPEEAHDAHNRLLASIEESIPLAEDGVKRVDAADSASELPGIFSDFFYTEDDASDARPEVKEAVEQYEKACADLQELAEVNGTGVDFDCSGQGPVVGGSPRHNTSAVVVAN